MWQLVDSIWLWFNRAGVVTALVLIALVALWVAAAVVIGTYRAFTRARRRARGRATQEATRS